MLLIYLITLSFLILKIKWSKICEWVPTLTVAEYIDDCYEVSTDGPPCTCISTCICTYTCTSTHSPTERSNTERAAIEPPSTVPFFLLLNFWSNSSSYPSLCIPIGRRFQSGDDFHFVFIHAWLIHSNSCVHTGEKKQLTSISSIELGAC